ncbi:tRNA A64-2'-O-ribosylphosphate transferase [[Candida] anglica]|uniref:tRNA A64-2'-O-ribosylphosphate transferase n=1 Tax=[Candida] anglica TaxID=148631 RepID=A0ABP0ECF6_9ASCO
MSDRNFQDDYRTTINSISKELRKESLAVQNRLQSILYDAKFVSSLVERGRVQYPMVANERCGCWYVPPARQIDTCYFKSTDGHTGQWKFSMRRLNLNLLPLIAKHGGVSVVDSTRRGKKIPDALSKTIPMWCAVLNRIRFGGGKSGEEASVERGVAKDGAIDGWLCTPLETVSRSEHSQMAAKIPGLAVEVERLGILTREKLEKMMDKPLIPEWYYPGMKNSGGSGAGASSGFHYIQCITASRQVTAANKDMLPEYYVQGSADDHELWATADICQGKLDPVFFWSHVVTCSDIVDESTGYIHPWMKEEELVSRLNSLYEEKSGSSSSSSSSSSSALDVTRVGATGLLFGSLTQSMEYNTIRTLYPSVKQVVVFSEEWKINGIPEESDVSLRPTTVHLHRVSSSKKGSKQLRDLLPKLVQELERSYGTGSQGETMVLCDTGKDLSVALVLTLLCRNFDLEWARRSAYVRANKDLVKQQLGLLSQIRKVNPSRNTLQSVNLCLMDESPRS